MNRFFWLTACLALLILGGGPAATASGQSLWQNRLPKWENPVGDQRAARPGDLLVVTIRERTNVQNRDQRQLQKQANLSTSAAGDFDVAGVLGDSSAESEANQDSDSTRRFNGNTQYRSERDFVDRFTVTVVDVLPNGNLVIAGKRRIGLEGDERSLVLTGTVRAIDVRADNTVASSLVAGLQLQYQAAEGGAEKAFINQGWMGRKFNRLWPF